VETFDFLFSLFVVFFQFFIQLVCHNIQKNNIIKRRRAQVLVPRDFFAWVDIFVSVPVCVCGLEGVCVCVQVQHIQQVLESESVFATCSFAAKKASQENIHKERFRKSLEIFKVTFLLVLEKSIKMVLKESFIP